MLQPLDATFMVLDIVGNCVVYLIELLIRNIETPFNTIQAALDPFDTSINTVQTSLDTTNVLRHRRLDELFQVIK